MKDFPLPPQRHKHVFCLPGGCGTVATNTQVEIATICQIEVSQSPGKRVHKCQMNTSCCTEKHKAKITKLNAWLSMESELSMISCIRQGTTVLRLCRRESLFDWGRTQGVAQGEEHMAAIMREWQTAILTGGHKTVQQLQRGKKKKRARERWSGGGGEEVLKTNRLRAASQISQNSQRRVRSSSE